MNEKNKHWGSTLNDFLYEEGSYEEAKAQATARVISWQLAQEMKKGITEAQMAEHEYVCFTRETC